MAYVVSFLTISAAWLGHTELTDGLERADQILLRINLLLLPLVFPGVAVAAYFGIAGCLVVPFREVTRLFRRS